MAISSSQYNDTIVEGMANGSIVGYSVSRESELTLPFDNSNPGEVSINPKEVENPNQKQKLQLKEIFS